MRADYRVVLDACVLIPMPLADTLLRMAEAPRLYLPKWSQTIMDEVTRNLISKWNMAHEKALRREGELRRHFPEAWVDGFEPLIDVVANQFEDRHVLATAPTARPREERPEVRRILPRGTRYPSVRRTGRHIAVRMHEAAAVPKARFTPTCQSQIGGKRNPSPPFVFPES